jgi:hypothetical protein
MAEITHMSDYPASALDSNVGYSTDLSYEYISSCEICQGTMSGYHVLIRIRKSLAANGTVACLGPTASADVRTDIKGHCLMLTTVPGGVR